MTETTTNRTRKDVERDLWAVWKIVEPILDANEELDRYWNNEGDDNPFPILETIAENEVLPMMVDGENEEARQLYDRLVADSGSKRAVVAKVVKQIVLNGNWGEEALSESMPEWVDDVLGIDPRRKGRLDRSRRLVELARKLLDELEAEHAKKN